MPQKISGTKDVHFFSVGKLQGRTLVVYMKKKAVCMLCVSLSAAYGTTDGQYISCSGTCRG